MPVYPSIIYEVSRSTICSPYVSILGERYIFGMNSSPGEESPPQDTKKTIIEKIPILTNNLFMIISLFH